MKPRFALPVLLALIAIAAISAAQDSNIQVKKSTPLNSQDTTTPAGRRAVCTRDYLSNKSAGLLITDIVVSGTTTISSSELDRITSKLAGACVDDDSDELEARVTSLFRDEGYFGVDLKSLETKPTDPLGVPKPVILEADLTEGPLYKLADIQFVDNHAFSAAKLRAVFPLKKGDLFKREKIAEGLQGIRKLYAPRGFRDLVFVPDTQSSDSTVILTITMIEGTQYHMGKLKVFAKKDIADRLQPQWRLREGAIFDLRYPDKFIETNGSLLPDGFTRANIQLVRNCPDALIDVRLIVDQTDPGLQSPAKDVPCEKSRDDSN
jgi:outer membrane protein assembly factor BamA